MFTPENVQIRIERLCRFYIFWVFGQLDGAEQFMGVEEMGMLVLGRKPGEYVMIGDDIRVEVVKSAEGDLRLGIQAPKDVTVVRGELLEQQNVKAEAYKKKHKNF